MPPATTALILVALLGCSCSAKLGREWHETGAPKSLYVSLDLGRDVDAEYVSAAASQTVGQNETTGLGIVGATAGTIYTVGAYRDIELGKQGVDETVVQAGAGVEKEAIRAGTERALAEEATKRAALP